MQLTQEADQDFLDRFVGGEVVAENDRHLTRGTATSLIVQNGVIVVSLKDMAWKPGNLDTAEAGTWKEILPHPAKILLSTSIRSIDDNSVVFNPTARGTSARITRVR